MMIHHTRRTFCAALGVGAATGLAASFCGGAQPEANGAEAAAEKEKRPFPRIDVHAHIAGNTETIANYLAIRDHLLAEDGADLAMWIDLGRGTPDQEKSLAESGGRVLSCIFDYSPHTGLTHRPDELEGWMNQGYIGYKIWAGPYHRRLEEGQEGYRYIDDPVHIESFAEMERIGLVGASIHIADPNGPIYDRTRWMPDPVEYWRNITAWHNVAARHPDLKAVVAHACWLICQDAQLDYLRYLLATFPNMSVDLAATFQYYYLLNRENLRDFMIEWADRILFGTDISRVGEGQVAARTEQYRRCFRILETDEMVEGGFFGLNETRGLALPDDVLANIYYRNAARIYPRVREQLLSLGYAVD